MEYVSCKIFCSCLILLIIRAAFELYDVSPINSPCKSTVRTFNDFVVPPGKYVKPIPGPLSSLVRLFSNMNDFLGRRLVEFSIRLLIGPIFQGAILNLEKYAINFSPNLLSFPVRY